MLDKQARSLANSDPVTSDMLRGLRSTLDDAFARNVSPADKAVLDTANRQWGIMRTMEKAIDPLSGEISPKKFLSELNRRNMGGVKYGKGNQDLVDIARIGSQFVANKPPSSGTAERALWQNLLSTKNPLTLLAGGASVGLPVQSIAGFAVPPLASKAMWSPNSYLSQGLLDLGAPSMIPGMTREGLLNLMMLEAGKEATH